jgi:hypothetical protein
MDLESVWLLPMGVKFLLVAVLRDVRNLLYHQSLVTRSNDELLIYK